MLTGQFRELSDTIGSGIPVRIYKLDNSGTFADFTVDNFTSAEEIPFPWSDHPWIDSFIGYSLTRDQMSPPGIITQPVILYCFYDADISLTFHLPIPKAKNLTIDYGVGQRPQTHDIATSGALLKGHNTSSITLCLPDGTPIDNLKKPLESTEIEVRIANVAGNRTISNYRPLMPCTFYPYFNGSFQYNVMSPTMLNEPYDITPVTFNVPASSANEITASTTVNNVSVPSTIRTFKKTYNVVPKEKVITDNGYIENTGGIGTASYKFLEFSKYIKRLGITFGNSVSSVPTSYPTSTPSLSSPTKWEPISGYGQVTGISVSASLPDGKYLPFRISAEVKDEVNTYTSSIGISNILMSRAPKLKSSTTTETTLSAWLRSSVDNSDLDVFNWWKDNFRLAFV